MDHGFLLGSSCDRGLPIPSLLFFAGIGWSGLPSVGLHLFVAPVTGLYESPFLPITVGGTALGGTF